MTLMHVIMDLKQNQLGIFWAREEFLENISPLKRVRNESSKLFPGWKVDELIFNIFRSPDGESR